MCFHVVPENLLWDKKSENMLTPFINMSCINFVFVLGKRVVRRYMH